MTPYNQYPQYGIDDDAPIVHDSLSMPRYEAGRDAPSELVCRCPSCATTLGVSAETTEHSKVQCMVCGTVFSPLGNTVSSGSAPAGRPQPVPPPASPYREASYYEPPAYGGIQGSAYPESSYSRSAYPNSAPLPQMYAKPPVPASGIGRSGGYPNDGYSDPYFAPEPPSYRVQPGPGYGDNNAYYRDPTGGYTPPPYSASAPYPAQMPGAYAPVPSNPMPVPSPNPYPTPAPPSAANPSPHIPPGIQQLPVRKPNETDTPVTSEKTEKPTEKNVAQAKKEALTGTDVPLGQDLEDIGTSQPFKLIKSEYDYYMKEEEAPPKKKGSFLKILFFLFAPLVGIGWSLWQLVLEKNLDYFRYGGISAVCLLVFLIALSAYNRNCPQCGSWSALIKEKKEDQYGRYVLRHCKHCDFLLESEK